MLSKLAKYHTFSSLTYSTMLHGLHLEIMIPNLLDNPEVSGLERSQSRDPGTGPGIRKKLGTFQKSSIISYYNLLVTITTKSFQNSITFFTLCIFTVFGH
uniref:Uncharacterized protein n=1 Tax=Cacopsylla melanoneura TaxID=428564 RepID=A0A8D9DWG0_9HEMI